MNIHEKENNNYLFKAVNNYYGCLVVVCSNPVHHARHVHHHLVAQRCVGIVLDFDYLLLGKSFLKGK